MPGYTLIAIALLLSGCAANGPAGTSTGNPAPKDEPDGGPGEDSDGDNLAGGGYCKAGEMTELGLEEDSPLGFSAADILAFAEGTHQETLRWNEPMGLQLSESGEDAITITVTASGQPRFVEPKEPEEGTATDNIGSLPGIDRASCVSWIEIDVDVTVETSSGALDESFEAVLRAHSPLTASLYATIEPDALGGNFEVEIAGSDLEGFLLTDLWLNVRFSEFGADGRFSGSLEKRTDDAVAHVAGGAFADFGAGTCGENADGFTIGQDDAVEGTTVQDALDAFNAHGDVDITWETGAVTTSTLAFAPATQGGCVLLDNETAGDLTLISDEGTLTMVSADGRLDAAWPGRLEAHLADDGSITRIQFVLEAKLPSHTEPGGNAALGFPTDEIASFDGAAVTADVTVTDSNVEGLVALTGLVRAECAEPPDQPGSDADPMTDPGAMGGTEGCRGSDPVTVASGTIE